MATRSTDRVDQPPEGSPDAPDTPLEIPARGWRAVLGRTVRETKEDRIPITAAGVALYWFLAIFPLLFAAVGLLAMIHASASMIGGIQKAIRTALPGDAASILVQAVSNAQTRAAAGSGLVALVVGVGLAVWSASSGMAASQVGLDVAYDVPEDRKFLKKRAVGIVLILVTLVLGGVATVLLVFGQPLGELIRSHVPGGAWFVWAWTVVRWVLTVLCLVILFAVFYYVGPNRKAPHWAWISPGGILATIVWLAASVGFSLYISTLGGSYAKTYGALAGVVVLVLWLYLSAIALLLGGELNGELERQRAIEEHRASSERQPSRRAA
jgi:membrane protein